MRKQRSSLVCYWSCALGTQTDLSFLRVTSAAFKGEVNCLIYVKLVSIRVLVQNQTLPRKSILYEQVGTPDILITTSDLIIKFSTFWSENI